MPIYFSRPGFELAQRRVREQEERVRSAGKDAGQEAGMNCDWHDNFGYEEAKRRLELEARKLADLLKILNDAEIITPRNQNIVVDIGSTVDLIINDKNTRYTIGAFGESNPSRGLISYTSPIAQALLEHHIDEEIETRIAGEVAYIFIKRILPPPSGYDSLIAEIYSLTNTPDDPAVP